MSEALSESRHLVVQHGQRDGRDHHLARSTLPQRPGALHPRRTGRHHVVHHQHARGIKRCPRHECIPDVGPAILPPQPGLRGRRPDALQGPGIQRNVEIVGHLDCQQLRLIEPPVAEAR